MVCEGAMLIKKGYLDMPIVFYSAVCIELLLLVLLPAKRQGLPIIFIGLLATIFAFMPITASDNWVYSWYYTHPGVPTKFEPLFNWLMQFSMWVGWDYYQFKLGLFALEMFLLNWGLNVMVVQNKRYVILGYTLIHLFESGVQLRNYLMAIIVFVALAYLWRHKQLDVLRFIALISIAALIQSAALIFLLMLPISKCRTRKSRGIILALVGAVSLFISLPITRAVYVSLVTGIAGKIPIIGSKLLQYALRFEPGMIILLDVPLTIGLFMLFTKVRIGARDEAVAADALFGQQLSLFLCLMFPMYLVAYNFDRILIDSLLVIFAIFAKFIADCDVINKRRLLGLSILLFGTYGYATYHYGAKYENTYEPALYRNIYLPDKNHEMKERRVNG